MCIRDRPETGNPDCKELEIRIARNWKSGTQKNRSPDCKNLDGSNTKINKTEKNHTDKSKGNTPALEEKFSQYGRFKNVVLSEAELQELTTLFPWDYQKRIDHLSVYMKSSGKEYQNHFATICLWAERDGTRIGMDKYEFQEKACDGKQSNSRLSGRRGMSSLWHLWKKKTDESQSDGF